MARIAQIRGCDMARALAYGNIAVVTVCTNPDDLVMIYHHNRNPGSS